jgi:uncharacterized protein YndB with AHSA1/START domain
MTISTPSDREILVTRRFNAPRALVWKAWTQPAYLARWWGPQGWTLPVCNVDLRPGGKWQYCMAGPQGEESCGLAIYHEIVEPERLVYTDYFADAQGNPVPNMPESRVTIHLTENDGMTLLNSTMLYPAKEDRDRIIQMGMQEGMTESLNRLDEVLQNA